MLKRKFRLPKIYFKGERQTRSSLFDLKIAKNGKDLSRFAFVVSKRIDKKAIVRNQVKRKFREFIERNLNQISRGYDFLFILRKRDEKENYEKALATLLKREKLFNENSSN